MRKSIYPLLFMILPLILSCWNSSPTSDKAKAYTVGGVVTDKNGTGIGGVYVQINGTNFSSTDTTDAVGKFEFENVKSGNYTVKAHKDSTFFKPANIEISVAKADIETLKFTSADNCIHGKVLDILTDKGIKGLTVRISPDKGGNVDSTKTDQNGEYYLFDKEQNNYNIRFINSNYSIWDVSYIVGSSYTLESKSFTNSEIIIPTFYFSSEKIQITTAEFSKDTKTLYLEWTPSNSAYASYYMIYRRGLPFDYNDPGGNVSGNSNPTNKATIKINSEYVDGFFDEDVISGVVYFAVSVQYFKGKDYFEFCSPISDDVGVRLSW